MNKIQITWAELKKDSERKGITMAKNIEDTIKASERLGYITTVEDNDVGITLYVI